MAEVKVPMEVYVQLGVTERKKFQKKVKIIFDKKQAAIRFPTVLVEELGLKEGDYGIVTVEKSSGKARIICELVLQDVETNHEEIKSKRETNIDGVSRT